MTTLYPIQGYLQFSLTNPQHCISVTTEASDFICFSSIAMLQKKNFLFSSRDCNLNNQPNCVIKCQKRITGMFILHKIASGVYICECVTPNVWAKEEYAETWCYSWCLIFGWTHQIQSKLRSNTKKPHTLYQSETRVKFSDHIHKIDAR